MNIDTAVMDVPRLQAHQAFQHYRSAVKSGRATRDDVALYKGLRALLRGQKVIDLPLAIGQAGTDVNGRPKLAVVRADSPVCHVRVERNVHDRPAFIFSTRSGNWGHKPAGETSVPLSTFPLVPQNVWTVTGEAQTPTIPPQHRPEGAVRDYHILFEAVWRRQPTHDPMLLKHIDGPFFVVLAAWDLTPLEQAILRQKL